MDPFLVVPYSLSLMTAVASPLPGDVHPPAWRCCICRAGHCVRDVSPERPSLLHHPRHCPCCGQQPGEEQIPCACGSLSELFLQALGQGVAATTSSCFPAGVPGRSPNLGSAGGTSHPTAQQQQLLSPV